MAAIDISFLHLTDLHVGMSDQKWLWPTVKHAVLEDISRIRDKVQEIDIVIFSGDLVQKGDKEEFDRLDQILGELWAKFKSVGCNPGLFHVPGNHDLARPPARDPSFMTISRWWDDTEVQNDFWKNEYGYFDKLAHIFQNYTAWSKKISTSSVVPCLGHSDGILPGDKSAVFIKGTNRIGLIGLNSTWLQFTDGDLQGKLAVEIRQIHAVTANDPKKWCDSNDANILVTHQPVNWLHPTSAAAWESEINPSGRFDLHLYGHMHQSHSASISTYGSSPRVS